MVNRYWKLSKSTTVLFVVIAAVQTLAVIQRWYSAYPWFDIPMHIAGGAFLGLIFRDFYIQKGVINPKSHPWATITSLVAFVALGGVLWELYEYYGRDLGLSFLDGWPASFGGGGLTDTLHDLINDILGGFFVSLITRIRGRKN